MATETTTATRTKGIEDYAGEGPKWRLEHASSAMAVCQKASCKREQIKFIKGELRIGTHTYFEPENRWYMAWRHWGCATKFQIRGLKEVPEGDATKAPGYDRLSSDAQEQVRLAFENEDVVDKDFKGIDANLAKVPKKYGGEIQNATGYKTVVTETLETGEVVEPPQPPVPVAKPKTTKKKVGNDDSNAETPKQKRKAKAKTKKNAEDEGDSDDASETKPKSNRKSKGKKRASDEMDDTSSEPEYVPRKTRSRAAPLEEVADPAIARIEAMAEALRTEAAK